MVPWWERDLDSFADDIITKASKAETWEGWYASLDHGPTRWSGDPDFATAASTRDEAVRLCAKKIRDDQRGIGRFAPHRLDLFNLRKHWATKEQP